MNARFRSVWMVIPLLVFAGTASAQDRPDRRDVRLADDIVHQVNTYSRFTIFDDVNARIDQGVVTLSGKVTMPYKKNDIGKRIAGIDGVREVENKIDVLPVSGFDDQLRHRIARAIYGHPSFWNYAAMANPPIHIIVENGRVTLTGVVNSNVERMLAEYEAAQVRLTVYDLSKQHVPSADEDRIAFTPTLVKRWPEPKMWVLGDLDDSAVVADLLSHCGVERHR